MITFLRASIATVLLLVLMPVLGGRFPRDRRVWVCALLAARIHPVVPEQGSVGASGDLAPLAHMSLVLIGEGTAVVKGERVAGLRGVAFSVPGEATSAGGVGGRHSVSFHGAPQTVSGGSPDGTVP